MNKISLKYKTLSNPIKATIWFALCNVLQKGIQFITVPLFTRILTTEQYGQYSIYTTWISILSIFTSLNLYMAVFNNGMLKYKRDRDGYISSMQGLATISTVLCYLLYIIFEKWWNAFIGLPSGVIHAMFLELLFAPALQFWTMKQRYLYLYKKLVIVTIFIALLNPALGFYAVTLTAEKGYARIYSVVFVNVLVGILFYLLNIVRGKKFFNARYWKFAVIFNVPLLPHYLSSIALSSADRVMIQNMIGGDKVAIYSIAYSISMLMNIFVSAINSTFAPLTYQKCEVKKYSVLKKTSNLLIIVMGVITLIPILLAPEAVSLMGPSEYREAIWVIPPVAISVLFIFIYGIYANVELYFEKTKYVTIASVIAALSNIILNYFFMKLFGYIAAGYTTFVCYGILALAHYHFYKKVCKENNVNQNAIYNSKLFLIVVCLISILACGLMLLYEHNIIRYLIIASLFICIVINHRKIKKFVYSLLNKKEFSH